MDKNKWLIRYYSDNLHIKELIVEAVSKDEARRIMDDKSPGHGSIVQIRSVQ